MPQSPAMSRCHVRLAPVVLLIGAMSNAKRRVLSFVGDVKVISARGMVPKEDLPTPKGVTAPRPVTTTLLNPSLVISSPPKWGKAASVLSYNFL